MFTGQEPSIAFIRECFICDPIAGTLHWRKRPIGHFASSRASSIFNKRRAGERAGNVSDKGYWVVSMTIYGVRRSLQVHRIIWAISTGKWPVAMLDHISCNQADSRMENLREATNAENRRNRGRQRNNKSGFKGVSKQGTAFQADITDINGKTIYLGRYRTPEEAHEAYKAAARKYHGEFARAA